MHKPYHYYIYPLFFCLFALGCGTPKSVLPTENYESSPATEETISVPENTESTKQQTSLSPDIQTTSDGITITNCTESSSFYSTEDPSVCILTATASYPKIDILDKTKISEKINALISNELNTFWDFEQENANYAQETINLAIEGSATAPEPYNANLSYELKRCDNQIISLVFSQGDYMGGAHGNYWSYGLTFDATTGERLYLEGLTNDYPAFHQFLMQELQAQAALPAYGNYLYSDMPIDIEASLLSDASCWYLDRSGISFISNPYVLGSYAAGSFEFNIPYADLNGLREEYAYHGSYIRKLFPGISVQHDINGNGITDEICYSTDENFSNAASSLSINGNQYSDQLRELYLSYPWTGAYYLIDIDPEDSYIEIAISNENIDNPDDTCTHFFRYSASNRLIYQGNTPGIFNEDMQVRYNANGNLILCGRNGEFDGSNNQ